MSTITVYHTSPVEITEIHKDGLFGDVLFFSIQPYFMCAKGPSFVYEMEIDEDLIDSVDHLWHRDDWENLMPIVEDVMRYADVDKWVAMDLLSEKKTPSDIGLDGEEHADMSWYIQQKQGECGPLLGEDAIESEDEQGGVYIVSMTGKLDRLKKSEGWND